MGRRSTVTTSPYKEEAVELLQSGLSPATVAGFLQERYGTDDIPSSKALARYRSVHIPPTAIVPASAIKQLLENYPHKVHLIGILERTIWALEYRFGAAFKREQGRPGAPLSPDVDRAFQSLHTCLQMYRSVAQNSGLLRKSPDRLQVDMGQTKVVQLGEADVRAVAETLALAKRAHSLRPPSGG